jgi:hypothetical protein
MTNVFGTARITSSTISNAFSNNIFVSNQSGVLSLSLTGNTISSDSARTNSLNGVVINALGTATINAIIADNTLDGHRFSHLSVGTSNSGAINVDVTGNTLACNNPIALSCGASFFSASDAAYTYHIENNRITGGGIGLQKNAGTGAMGGSLANNTIGTSGVPGSGGGLFVTSQVSGVSHLVSITGNVIRRHDFRAVGLSAFGSGAIDATISGNLIEEPDGAASGVHVQAGNVPESIATVCLAFAGNSITGAGVTADFELVQAGATSIRLPGYAGLNSDNAAVVAFVRANQTGATATTPTGIATNNVAGGGGGFVGGGSCATPPP